YAAPTSSLRSAMVSSAKLSSAHTAKATVGQSRVRPWLIFSDTAKPVSNRPAARIVSHAIASPPLPMLRFYEADKESRCDGDGARMEGTVRKFFAGTCRIRVVPFEALAEGRSSGRSAPGEGTNRHDHPDRYPRPRPGLRARGARHQVAARLRRPGRRRVRGLDPDPGRDPARLPAGPPRREPAEQRPAGLDPDR